MNEIIAVGHTVNAFGDDVRPCADKAVADELRTICFEIEAGSSQPSVERGCHIPFRPIIEL